MSLVRIIWRNIQMHDRANDAVRLAKSFVGVPFKHQGCNPLVGFDCAGLILYVAHDLGLIPCEKQSYSRRPQPNEFRQTMLRLGCTPIAEPMHGDMIRIASPEWPVHIAFYEQDGNDCWIIHAYAKTRCVVRQKVDDDVRKTFREYMRLPA